MKISADVANELAHVNEYEGWRVVARQDDGEGRWYSYHTAVIVRNDLEGWWAFGYDNPLTENQEYVDFEEDVNLYKVFPRVVTTTVYEEKR